jgi:hypothetical protein
MDNFPHPPWSMTGDEVSDSDTTKFADCEQAIDAFASRTDGKITERRYSVSEEWGRILRAKVGFAHGSIGGTVLVTCWTGEGPGVRIAMEIDGCGPQQAGC